MLCQPPQKVQFLYNVLAKQQTGPQSGQGATLAHASGTTVKLGCFSALLDRWPNLIGIVGKELQHFLF